MAEPQVLGPQDGLTVDVFGNIITFKATAGAFSLAEGTFPAGGFAPLPHIHHGEDESFYIIDGLFDVRVGDSTVHAEPGTYIFVPRGTAHGFTNVGDRAGRLLFMHSPAYVDFFIEIDKLTKAGPPDPAAITALMRRFNMDVVTPA
jgi:mannose-6-phosphate isomerase-like protein (cupin superfamily)